MKKHIRRVKKHIKETHNLRLFNNFLTVIAIGLGLYIILAPLLPQFTWWMRESSPAKAWASQSDEVQKEADGTIGSDRLLIPKLGLNEVIFDGSKEPLSKGVIHRSQTSTPDQGGNTVLVGHRFMYDVKGVFYHLDKLSVGDEITVHWFPERYDYRVTKIFEVGPEAVEIEAPTDNSVLTLYTCTPLWSAKNRLVIQAELVGDS